MAEPTAAPAGAPVAPATAGEPVPAATTPAEQEGAAPATAEASQAPATAPVAEPAPSFEQQTDAIKEKANNLDQLLQDAGVVPTDLAQAVKTSNGEVPLDVSIKLIEKYGDGVAGLVISKIEALHTDTATAAASRDTAIYDQVKDAFGDTTEQTGKETWAELATWAKTGVDDGERRELNALLEKGGLSAKLATQNLIDKFKASDDFTQPAELLTADSLSNNFAGPPLTKAEYDSQLRTLLSKGHIYETSQEIQQLDRKRMTAIKRGY